MTNSNSLKFATYLVRGIILVFAFLVLSTVFAFGREIIREIFRSSVITDALSLETCALISGLSVGILAGALFSCMYFAWKLAKRIGTVNNEPLKSKAGKIDGVIRCPSCNTYQHDKAAHCLNCGYIFAGSEKKKTAIIESNEENRNGNAKNALTPKSQPSRTHANKTREPLVTKKEQAMPSRSNGEFPYTSELNRRIYAHLLKDKKDEATMLQAKVECGNDKEKIETTYYKLRYAQIAESGNVDELKAAILAEKRKSRDTVNQKPERQGAVRSSSTYKQQTEISSISAKPADTPPSPTSDVINRDGVYLPDTDGIVKDTKTGLEWIAGPDRNTTWQEAKKWVDNLSIDGGGWRMPTIKELRTLYSRTSGPQYIRLLKTTGRTVWSGEKKDSSFARTFCFFTCRKRVTDCERSIDFQAFAVRSRSDG